MAQNYLCDNCGEVAADFMITTIQDGEVEAIGIECLLDWALPKVEAYQAAVEREQRAQGDPGTVAVTALDPPDTDRTDPADMTNAEYYGALEHGDDPNGEGPEGPQEPPEGSDAEWEQSARPKARGGRKRGTTAPTGDQREDTQAEAAAHDRR